MEPMDLEMELNEDMEAELERRVREAVEEAREEWEKEAAEHAGAAGEDQRAKYSLARREAALAERERRLMERELKAMALEKLAERGLPKELADALSYADEKACMETLDKVERAFRDAVQAGVDERLRGVPPLADASRKADGDALSDAEYYGLKLM